MRLGHLARLGGLLRRLGATPLPTEPGADPKVNEERDLSTRGGSRYDLYVPKRGELRGVAVAVHGMTMQGNRDERLIHFARALARSKVGCVTPRLPGLASCRFRPADVDDLVEICDQAPPQEHAGVIGFSFGGSYALLAASRAGIAERLRFVLTFGAYHDLQALMDDFDRGGHLATPKDDKEWDERIYVETILAHQHGAAAGLPEALRADCAELLGRYCHGASPEEKLRFHRERLAPLQIDTLGLGRRFGDPTIHAELSPAGRLAGIRCPVGLVHDVADPLIPPDHGRSLRAELEALDDGLDHGLLVTPLVSHVDLRSLLRLGELGRFLALLEPLIANAG